MSSKDRVNIFPSRMNLGIMKEHAVEIIFRFEFKVWTEILTDVTE